MRILIFTGSHNRHYFVHREVVKYFNVCGVVAMEREPAQVKIPEGLTFSDAANFTRHFADRYTIEQSAYGELDPKVVFRNLPIHYCKPSTLNTNETLQFIEGLKPDIVFIFGVDLIKDPIFSRLPRDKVNLHLGLSPWYRGSATLFWPFYNLEPQFAGATFHQIIAEADAGKVIHQLVPELRRGDGIHDVAARLVIDCSNQVVRLLEARQNRGEFAEHAQNVTGRLYLSNHFHASHLRLVYDLFDNRIVDYYLEEKLTSRTPKLVSGFAASR